MKEREPAGTLPARSGRMSPAEIEVWASAYVEYYRQPNRADDDPLWWAIQRFMPRDADPEDCWCAILEILSRHPSGDVIAVLAAGPLEDLLVRHGPEFIDRVEQQSRQDAAFRHLLGGVWPSSIPWAVWQRIIAARGEEW